MGYNSQISFTLDTICPWYFPHQLYPEASKEGEDKYEWYKHIKFNDSEDKMQKYTTLMNTYGEKVGIDFDFHGTVANTFDAHRLIQHYQEELGPGVADDIVNSLYTQYFTQRAHPSAPDTLIKAATAAGIDQRKAEAFVNDEYEGTQETKMLLREQVNNGIDSCRAIDKCREQVPHIVVEGKRRDFTLEGAKEVGEYLKTLEAVVKEAQ
ncbi:MAG: hypothetical protein Q9208_006868 [Pyrenodesmia sp. 3 TL-2023]